MDCCEAGRGGREGDPSPADPRAGADLGRLGGAAAAHAGRARDHRLGAGGRRLLPRGRVLWPRLPALARDGPPRGGVAHRRPAVDGPVGLRSESLRAPHAAHRVLDECAAIRIARPRRARRHSRTPAAPHVVHDSRGGELRLRSPGDARRAGRAGAKPRAWADRRGARSRRSPSPRRSSATSRRGSAAATASDRNAANARWRVAFRAIRSRAPRWRWRCGISTGARSACRCIACSAAACAIASRSRGRSRSPTLRPRSPRRASHGRGAVTGSSRSRRARIRSPRTSDAWSRSAPRSGPTFRCAWTRIRDGIARPRSGRSRRWRARRSTSWSSRCRDGISKAWPSSAGAWTSR